MIEGLSHLITIRRSGHKPHSIMLTIDGDYLEPKYEQEFSSMNLVIHGSVRMDDFRAFKDLHVIFCCSEWSKTASDAFDKLKEYASQIDVLCAAYGLDLGFVWTKKFGPIDLDKFHWIQQFHNAKNTLCRTDKEVAERLRLETEALEHFPDLESYGG